MSRTKTLGLVAGLAALVALLGTGASQGADLLSATASPAALTTGTTDAGMVSTANFDSFLYDYDVYASEPQEWAYWVRWYYRYSQQFTEDGPFSSYAAAERHLRYSRKPWGVRGEIVEHLTALDFRFIDRCDTYAEASELADVLESFGLVVEIRRYSDIVYVDDEPVLKSDF